MTSHTTQNRKRGLLGLIFLLCLLSACSLSANAPATNTPIPQATPGTPSQTIPVNQTATYEGSNDPWTFTYRSLVVKIVSTNQQKSFPDDPDPSQPAPRPSANMLFRLSLQITNPNKHQEDLSWYDAWHLTSPMNGTIAPSLILLNEIQPGTTTTWLDFPLEAPLNLQDVKLVVGELDELLIETSLDRPGDLSRYRTKSITTHLTFLYGNSEWTVEKITSCDSIAIGGADGSASFIGLQAKMDSRYIILQMKEMPRNNGIAPDIWKNVSFSFLDGVLLVTGSPPEIDAQGYQPGGTLPNLLFNSTGVLDGTLIFQAVVDRFGSPNPDPVPMSLVFPALSTLNVGKVEIKFSI